VSIHNFIRCYLAVFKTLAKLAHCPYSPFQNGIPMILPSSGSMADNGAVTLTTALPATYSSCYVYLPANAISAGSAAGLYYAVMSSTTVGTVYNNTYTGGEATIPTSPTAFATTGPGAFAQTTAADITLLTWTLAGGALSKTGSLFAFPLWAINSSGNQKIIRQKINTVDANVLGFTTTAASAHPYEFRNRGVLDKNVSNGAAGFGANTTAPVSLTADTSANVTIELTARLATATDYVVLSGVTYQINP
jgi:hypothetical protein